MKRALQEIEVDFSKLKKQEASYDRNMALVGLMNELEKYYGTMVIYEADEQLEADIEKNVAIRLYREISYARTEVN